MLGHLFRSHRTWFQTRTHLFFFGFLNQDRPGFAMNIQRFISKDVITQEHRPRKLGVLPSLDGLLTQLLAILSVQEPVQMLGADNEMRDIDSITPSIPDMCYYVTNAMQERVLLNDIPFRSEQVRYVNELMTIVVGRHIPGHKMRAVHKDPNELVVFRRNKFDFHFGLPPVISIV